MANSLESEAEEDEKKNGIFLFSPQQIKFRALHPQKKRCWSMESDNVSNAGFLYWVRKKVFNQLFLSTIKTKQALGLK